MNLYILTEERPKQEVLHTIITRFLQDKNLCAFVDTLKILPIVKENCFTFSYEILGVSCKAIEKIYVKIVSGTSSFVDYLIFFKRMSLLLKIFHFMRLKRQRQTIVKAAIQAYINALLNLSILTIFIHRQQKLCFTILKPNSKAPHKLQFLAQGFYALWVWRLWERILEKIMRF